MILSWTRYKYFTVCIVKRHLFPQCSCEFKCRPVLRWSSDVEFLKVKFWAQKSSENYTKTLFLFQNNVFQGIFTRINRRRDSKGLKKSKIRLENSRKKHDIFPKKTTRSTIKHDTNLIVKHDTESWVLTYRTIPDHN